MIYVPELNDTYICYSFIDNNTIRAYKTTNINSNNEIIDIYVNSHYLTSDNVVLLSEQPNCIPNEKLTNDWKYRNDIADILIISTLGLCFYFLLPLFIFRRLFKIYFSISLLFILCLSK